MSGRVNLAPVKGRRWPLPCGGRIDLGSKDVTTEHRQHAEAGDEATGVPGRMAVGGPARPDMAAGVAATGGALAPSKGH